MPSTNQQSMLHSRFRHEEESGEGFGEYDGEGSTPPSPPTPPDGRFMLMLGPIHPREGCVALLKAVFELGPAADGWSVVIAGREIGSWRKELDAAIQRKGGAGRVHFTAAGDIATQRAWLSRASILASPSLHIGCGVGVLQAVASGVPVLASTLCTPPALLDVIKACGPVRHELVRALRQLLEMSDDQRTELAQRAREKARATVDWSALSAQYSNLYEGLV
ncbi:MAG: glycosyltransferase family 4 protein [Planctomycetes bacterium]|nr:glycosyltransferase family 4 protein [Planctomycetota bacterium]